MTIFLFPAALVALLLTVKLLGLLKWLSADYRRYRAWIKEPRQWKNTADEWIDVQLVNTGRG